jgi:hypothetical protein
MSLSQMSFFDTTLGLTLDLHELFTLLHHPRMPASAAHHLSKLKYLDGAAQLKLDASGPVDDLGSLAFGGKIEVLGATVDYHHFRKAGKDLTGTIHFTPYLIKSDNLRGYWANSPITAWFEIENYLSRPKAMLTAHVESDKSEINDVASAFFPWEGVSGEGLADIYVDLSCAEYRTGPRNSILRVPRRSRT